MRTTLAVPKVLTIVLAAGFALTGCTTARAPDADRDYPRSVSPQLRAHRQKQQLRYEEGNYRRLYRPKGCRYAARDCDGYGRFSPTP